MSQTNEIITSIHQRRIETYYSVTEDQLFNIRDSGFKVQIFLALFTMFSGAILSIIITKISISDLTDQVNITLTIVLSILAFVAIVFGLLTWWQYSSNNSIFSGIKQNYAKPIGDYPTISTKEEVVADQSDSNTISQPKILKIKHATYSTKDGSSGRNVTGKIEELTKNNSLYIIPNQVLKDFSHGEEKELKIIYEWHDFEFNHVFSENQQIKLP
jgi:hypothetical protein